MSSILPNGVEQFQEPASYAVENGDIGRVSRRGTRAGRDPWEKVHLLTLDGGGVRGYWSLLVLKRLMEFIAEHETRNRRSDIDQKPAWSSFEPMQYPLDVSHLPWTAEERQSRQEQDLDPAQEYRALHPAKRYLPCHYFDYIGGSSTGGLIAIMLGRLRMTVADCLHEYEQLGSEIFGQPRLFCQINIPILKRTKYDSARVARVYEDVVRRRRETSRNPRSIPNPMFPSKSSLCRTFVTTIATNLRDGAPGEVSQPHVVRSYPHQQRMRSTRAADSPQASPSVGSGSGGDSSRPESPATQVPINTGPAHNLPIHEVARAATAAPFFFKPVHVDCGDGRAFVFEDGGFAVTNNPTMVGIREIHAIHGEDRVGLVVSIGTARSNAVESRELRQAEATRRRLESIVNAASSPDIEHQAARSLTTRDKVPYYRLNAESSEHMLNCPLDQWLPRKPKRRRAGLSFQLREIIQPGMQTKEYIEARFLSWIGSEQNRKRLDKCARALVDRRRERTADESKWERYSIGAEFRCKRSNAGEHCDRTFVFRSWFEEHLVEHHNVERTVLQEAAKGCMTRFTYQPVR